MPVTRSALLLLASTLALLPSCADPKPGPSDGGPDQRLVCTDPAADHDTDGIPDGIEGCASDRDSDGDKTPDWLDTDSDDDGIPDHIEAGSKDAAGKCAGAAPPAVAGWPCDSDGDGKPDYIDTDSDNDSLLDKDEDFNGDGLLGCCRVACEKPAATVTGCTLTADGCGSGQSCQGGQCSPPRDVHCSNGETDPRRADTFGDGIPDADRGTFICRDATPERPKGREPMRVVDSKAGAWRVALSATRSRYVPLVFSSDDAQADAATLDDAAADAQVAGFVVSRSGTKPTVTEEATAVLGTLLGQTPGGPGVMAVRVLGSPLKTHDRYDAVVGTTIDLKLAKSQSVVKLRNEVVARLLGVPVDGLKGLPAEFGDPATEFVLRFVTIRRFGFKKDPRNPGRLRLDERGYPIDDGDSSKWQVVVMGAVVSRQQHEDPKRRTALVLDDFSNGSAVAGSSYLLGDECAAGRVTATPAADIIWVIDDSGSMNDQRQSVAENAKNFFAQALATGLDFRVGVTGTFPAQDGSGKTLPLGKLCSKISTETNDDGGEDRFLLPSEQAIFEACVANPPYSSIGREYGLENARAAVASHLPRAANDPARIRPGATLVVVIVTDEAPQELKDIGLFPDSGGSPVPVPCTLSADDQKKVDELMAPYLEFFAGKAPLGSSETRASLHFIGGLCSSGCEAQIGHGYLQIARASGILADICQTNLAPSLQEIFAQIIGKSSPVVLDHAPISASLAVAVGNKQVPRSRVQGFDLVSGMNSLAFYGIPFPKGSMVVTSYRRWVLPSGVQ